MHHIWKTAGCSSRLGRFQQVVWSQQLTQPQQRRHYHAEERGVYGYKPSPPNSYQVCEEALASRARQAAIFRLVEAYRTHAHKVATFNPLAGREVRELPELEPARYGLSDGDPVSPEGLVSAPGVSTVGQLVEHLKTAYCGRLSAQFTHCATAEEQEWLAERLETVVSESLSSAERLRIGEQLIHSQVLDKFLSVKFATVKRYGGEGAEATSAFLGQLLALAAAAGLREVVMAMAHRGRLNLLTGLLQYPPVQMFQKMRGMREFPDDVKGIGDVLSHLNSNVDLEFDGHKIHAVLLSNPSHLEAVNPVAMGRVRAREQTAGYGDYSSPTSRSEPGDHGLCVQIHGDAALSAQGIIQESLAISNLPHSRVGGSIHLAINNQVGYTTPEARGRSSSYCTDVAKLVDAPVIRANGDFPEDVVRACRVAFEYRQRFRRDVFVDLVCFRRWGHNELDDPTLTNPSMYRNINTRVSVPDRFVDALLEDDLLTMKDVERIQDQRYSWLNQQLAQVDSHVPKANHLEGGWRGMQQAPSAVTTWDTGVDPQLLKYIGGRSVEWPSNFVVSVFQLKGTHVRLCGQDVGRGTFSQRHVMLVDQITDHVHVPLNSLTDEQTGFIEVANSALTEEAMLAFEYGVSIESPNRLCIWEAQFGDFFNGAQIPIDTMFASGEAKWLYQSALTMILPHGIDGTGPEHSSCRMERFLQLTDSKEDAVDGKYRTGAPSDDVNLHIVNPTTPAQNFHALRRQMVRNFRKPLLIVGPKMLLRHPQATSSLADMAPGTHWLPVIGADGCSSARASTTTRWRPERAAAKRSDVAIVRLEQLTPFPTLQLNEIREKYSKATKFIWSQEEHRNQGAWTFVQPRFYNLCATKREAKHVIQAPFNM
ncbi:putative 2-oxoglutarate dehydrogenase E1 component DHKTD1, mitochondrial [Amphibalanus amphitrite]|uniref:Putative 2-oxoglutarate dehydrogenase E1 component DHKTD1, mitochondrial n=1 Tax=Amphibalanus amphitrite TaxID=1232801 RepID=A0A6A4WL37_AMPAM|nr:putative 2-oxoglutarate dehydrogenase E1 component DHKTD1, mitochondrial [Amphibalanus amphitrite]